MPEERTCHRHADRRAAVGCQRCDRPICTSCMREASVGFHCPECAAGGRQRVYTARTLPGSGTPLVTVGLVVANVAVFVVGLGLGSAPGQARDRLTVEGGLFGPLVDAGEWYRIVTSGFLHAGALHLAFNMYLLYLLGQLLEPELGRLRFGLVYAFSLLAGSFGVLLVSPTALTVGASGAVFGLMGTAIVWQRSAGINPLATGLGALVGLNLVITFVVPNISVGGHVGGLVGGLPAAAVLLELPRGSPALPRAVPPVLLVLGGGALVAGCLWAAAVGTTV